ncbi:MAG: SurA N-terminal domain-containing protein [Rikenellaceae bacterium]
MVSLNTLRTRFGVVLSAIIAIALLAFIFSLKAEMGFMGNETVVAQINGHDVTISDYQKEYNKILSQSGLEQVDEQQAEMIYRSTWQALVTKYVLRSGIEELGMEVSDMERMAILRGEIPTQTMYSAFADGQTGMYNIAMVNNFLMTSIGNVEAEAVWAMLNDEARTERLLRKYGSLVSLGLNVNKLEVAQGSASNKNYSGRWAMKSYADIEHSLVNVTDSEVESYYKANKSSYERQPTREITYVMFNLMPSIEDLNETNKQAEEVRKEFAKGTTSLERYLRESRLGRVADSYVAASQLSSQEASAMAGGRVYGPSGDGVNVRISRSVATLNAPDTMSIRHIVLPYTEEKLADSLYKALRRNGSQFERAAERYSVFSETAQRGGDVGELPFSAFTEEFAKPLASASRGSIVRVESGDMIQLIQVYKVGRRVRQYKIASVELPLIASAATRTKVHGDASLFASSAKGGVKGFEEAVKDAAVSQRKAQVTSASRVVTGIAGSQELARWAHTASVGDISEIFKVDNGYVIAVLSEVNKSKHRALNEVSASIKSELLRKKKYDYIVGQIKGASFEDQAKSLGAEVKQFSDVTSDAFYINGMGVEPRVIGAITATKTTGVVSEPIEGSAGVYIYNVRTITSRRGAQSAEQVASTREASLRSMVQQMLYSTLESSAKIVDKRGEVL